MSHDNIESKNVRWLHVSHVNEKDFEFLQANFKFHHLDYEDIRSDIHLSKLDTYKHYLFFVFQIPRLGEGEQIVSKEELYVFLADKQIVTVTHTSMPAVDDLFERVVKNQRFRANLMGKGPAFLMYQILHEAFRNSREIIASMSREVNRLDQEIGERNAKTVTVELGHARRNVLYLRHVIDPQRNMIASLLTIRRPFIPEEVFVYFDDLQDSLDTIWLAADNLKLLLDGLFDVNEALLSHRTNEVITVLTIISASLMIPTLIAGFYGMNVPWLPFAHNPFFVSLLYIVGFLGILWLVIRIVKKHR